MSNSRSCKHSRFITGPSPNAVQSGYVPFTDQQRAAATTSQGRVSASQKQVHTSSSGLYATSSVHFPAPLVLPEDDLDVDPKYPPQSLLSWTRLRQRNAVTYHRKTLYLAAPPSISASVGYIQNWITPSSQALPHSTAERAILSCLRVDTQDIQEYLVAFYHGMQVKRFPEELTFTKWDDGTSSSRSKGSDTKIKQTLPSPSSSQYIGLKTSNGCTRIRARCPAPDGGFGGQLNLSDLLDAAINMLPRDAYALLVLIDHDMYEDEDDDFACGRAYGGSRVAVVSSTRYHPGIDSAQDVEREHAWPASHCEAYIQQTCRAESSSNISEPEEQSSTTNKNKNKNKNTSKSKPPPTIPTNTDTHTLSNKQPPTPLSAAITAYTSLPPLTSRSSTQALSGLWLSRICRTASHELNHCLGIDHCVYYACSMQGTTSICEDARQPPYLCPVDLAKVLRVITAANATGTGGGGGQRKERKAEDAGGAGGVEGVDMVTAAVLRYRALLSVCEKYEDSVHLFAAYAAWIRERLKCIDMNMDTAMTSPDTLAVEEAASVMGDSKDCPIELD